MLEHLFALIYHMVLRALTDSEAVTAIALSTREIISVSIDCVALDEDDVWDEIPEEADAYTVSVTVVLCEPWSTEDVMEDEPPAVSVKDCCLAKMLGFGTAGIIVAFISSMRRIRSGSLVPVGLSGSPVAEGMVPAAVEAAMGVEAAPASLVSVGPVEPPVGVALTDIAILEAVSASPVATGLPGSSDIVAAVPAALEAVTGVEAAPASPVSVGPVEPSSVGVVSADIDVAEAPLDPSVPPVEVEPSSSPVGVLAALNSAFGVAPASLISVGPVSSPVGVASIGVIVGSAALEAPSVFTTSLLSGSRSPVAVGLPS